MDINKENLKPCKIHKTAFPECAEFKDSLSFDGYVDKDDFCLIYDKDYKQLDPSIYRAEVDYSDYE